MKKSFITLRPGILPTTVHVHVLVNLLTYRYLNVYFTGIVCSGYSLLSVCSCVVCVRNGLVLVTRN